MPQNVSVHSVHMEGPLASSPSHPSETRVAHLPALAWQGGIAVGHSELKAGLLAMGYGHGLWPWATHAWQPGLGFACMGRGCSSADALDNVWYDLDRLAVGRKIPLPFETELRGLIPSERFPSDHSSVHDSPPGSADQLMSCPMYPMQDTQLALKIIAEVGNVLECLECSMTVIVVECITLSLPCRWHSIWSGASSSQQVEQNPMHPQPAD